MKARNKLIAVFLCWAVLAAARAIDAAENAAPSAPPSAEQLQQLVAPMALYPDELVAQVLAAATFPAQVVEANRWLRQHSTLKDAALGDAVDKQPWDASVKALAPFPSVLANLDRNLSWTSALGDAYADHPQQVLDAVQAMRRRARDAGTLKSGAQQTVTSDETNIVVEPANPQVVYVPQYDPWIVYGAPLAAYPGYLDADYFFGPALAFDTGFFLRPWYARYRWGWRYWGCDWRHRFITFNRARFISRAFAFRHGGIIRPGAGIVRGPRPALPGRPGGVFGARQAPLPGHAGAFAPGHFSGSGAPSFGAGGLHGGFGGHR